MSRSRIIFLAAVSVCLALIYLVVTNCMDEIELSRQSSVLKDRKLFSHLTKAEGVSYSIISRESLSRNSVHRIYFYVEVSKEVSREKLMAVAQKIVKETISREICNSINIDFGSYGYVDFAPYGNWARAGEVPVENYKDYRFTYVFSSSFPGK